MELCVNNSYSGSGVMGFDTDISDDNNTVTYNNYTVAGMSRARQLHTTEYKNVDGKTIPRKNPDYIAVYLGTNDIKNRTSGLSTFANNKQTMLDEAAALMAGTLQPKDVTEKFSLYVYMVEQMRAEYPDAQIYLFTLLPNETQNEVQARAMSQYNQSIRDLVTYYQNEVDKKSGGVVSEAARHRVVLVDLYNDTSITNDLNVLEKHLANTLHPNAAGMDAITNCFLSELVPESGIAYKNTNWKEVEYDLTDVYVAGGQINTFRASDSDMVPLSVTLVPSRPEYGLDVKVEVENSAGTVTDITSKVYSDGTIFAANISHYKLMRITAKAVYDTKNFRWELGDKGLQSCINDGRDYNILGDLTQNGINLIQGTSTNGKLDEAQYKLDDTILLRNEEPWVLEWKATGNLDWDHLLFSNTSKSATRSNTYVFFDDKALTEKRLFLGFYNSYRNIFWNYGVVLPNTLVFDEQTSHVYRLTNVIADDGSNMVYLTIDGVDLGAMNQYAVGTTFQTGELKDESWLNGRDLEFSFLGAENNPTSHRLQDCKIEYIQVWEGGEFDTLRLQQLVNEYDELKDTLSGVSGWTAYEDAVTSAKNYLNGNKDKNNHQDYYDSLVDAILSARNKLTGAAAETKIYGVELLSRNYVPIGKPAALKIVTSPDVQKIQVDNTAKDLVVNTSSLQTIRIGGVDTQVKVWLVSFYRTGSDTTSHKIIQFRIHALKDANATASDSQHGDASVLFDVPYGSTCFSDLRVTKAPDKVKYVAGESFDPAGMEVTAYFGDGATSEVVTGYTVYNQAGVENGKLAANDTAVIIRYTHTDGTLSVLVPVSVAHHVSDMAEHALDTEVVVQGYYVGVAQEGISGDDELVLKDMNSNALIYVRNIPGTFPDYGCQNGDLLRIAGTLKADNAAATPGKRYIDYNPDKTGYSLVSRGNKVTFKMTDVVEVRSWDQLQTYINDGTIKQDTYVRFRGNLFISTYSSDTDPVISYRLHMNSNGTTLDGIKVNGKCLAIRANTLEKNLGSDPLAAIVDAEDADGKFPGEQLFGTILAVYTGGNNTYYSFTIFDADWIDLQQI